jgi:MFS family permease|eukprot:g2692.t1
MKEVVAGDLVDVRRADEESKLFQLRGLHLVNILGFSLTMSAKMEFLLKSMKGVDFARVMSQNMIFMMVGRILTAPFVTQLSSVVGRLKVYYMIMASYVLTDVLHAAMPSVRWFSWISRLGFLSMGPYMQLTQIQVADIFPNEPKRVAIESGKLGLSFVVASFVVPTLNRVLYQRNYRFPFLFAALLHSAELFISILCKGETLQDNDRKRWEDIDWKSLVNPFLCLRLFNSGAKLALLSASHVLDLFVHTQSFARICNLVRMDTHGSAWGIGQRSTFETYSACVMVPSFLFGGKIFEQCGADLSFYGSYLVETVRFYTMSLLSKPWQEYLAMLMLGLRQPGNTALNALLRIEAKKAGLNNSELSSCMTNLVQVAMLTNGVVLNRLYFAAHRAGHPRRFFLFCTGFPIVQLALYYWFDLGAADKHPSSPPQAEAKRKKLK